MELERDQGLTSDFSGQVGAADERERGAVVEVGSEWGSSQHLARAPDFPLLTRHVRHQRTIVDRVTGEQRRALVSTWRVMRTAREEGGVTVDRDRNAARCLGFRADLSLGWAVGFVEWAAAVNRSREERGKRGRVEVSEEVRGLAVRQGFEV